MPKKKVLDDVTIASEWYMKDAKSDAVKSRLSGKPDGSFAIRNSSSEPGKYVLAYNYQGIVKNLHVDGDSGSVKLSKSTKTFNCISDLVKHYCEKDSGDLLCKLVGAQFMDPKTLKRQAKEQAKLEKQKAKSPPPTSPSGPPGMMMGMGSAGADKPDPGKGYGKEWKVQDVCDWLTTMDMEEYVVTFKKNKIDGTALLLLDDNDLRQLGIGAFGARKKLVAAIQTLNKKFREMEETGRAPPGLRDNAPAPVTTIGLIARNVEGQVKIFDAITGQEIFDIAAHQQRKQEELAAGIIDEAGRPLTKPKPKSTNFTIDSHTMELWYDKTMLKAKINELLEPLQNGEFVVRDSNTNPGCFGFSMVHMGKVVNKLIEPTNGGVHFKGSGDVFPNLSALIDHYTSTPGGILPCPIRYPADGSREIKIQTMPYWNCMDMDKASAMAKIRGKQPGAFVIRPSDKSYAAITVVKPDGSFYNQHIDETSGGLQLKKSSIAHANLDKFVMFYTSSSQKDLPCALITEL